jgi:tetratricopeptide (TPR) repeat protein
MPESRPWRTAALVGMVAVAAQAVAIRDVLLWDDIPLLARSDLYTNAARWTESVTSPLGRATYYWRPAATTSFLLESLVHGGAAWGFRLTSALLHAATSAVAFVLLRRLLGNRTAALLAALAFAVHPVNVEAATWISARFDLMAGLFSLAALAAIPAGAAPRWRWILAAAFAFLACCSKENAYLLPLLAVAWTAATDAAPGRPRLAPLAWTTAGVLAALFLRFEALGDLPRTRTSAVAAAGSALQHLLLVGRAVATSVGTIVFPWGTVGPTHHGLRPIPPDDALGWTGVVVGVVLTVVTAVALKRRRPVGYVLAAFLASLAPASQVVPLDLSGGLHTADRYAYLPSFFAVAAVALWATEALAARPAWARRAAVAAGALVAALAAGRLAILPRWNDPVTFWSWAVRMAPGSDAAHINLAFVHLAAGRPQEAEAEARLGGGEATSLLVEALVRQGRTYEAQRVLNDVIPVRPADNELRMQRAEIELSLTQYDAALADFQGVVHAQELTSPQWSGPLLPRAFAGIATVHAAKPGGVGTARGFAARAEALADAKDAGVWLSIARAWIAIRDMDRAAAAIDRAVANGGRADDVSALRAELRK